MALSLASLALLTARAQAPAPSLGDAERAFTEALMRHDRAAFVALFLPDAEASFPVAKQGPEAIANEWLPFLIDPGTTMVLTSTGVLTAPSGDMGNTTGTFAIRGRTQNGIQTIPAGTYSIVWKLVAGQWQISTLAGSAGGTSTARDQGGVWARRSESRPFAARKVGHLRA